MRKHWGWGTYERQLTQAQLTAAAPGIVEYLGFGCIEPEAPVPLDQARLPTPRMPIEGASTDAYVRASHAMGKAYRDVVRGFRGDFSTAPDGVLFPRDENDVEQALEWCAHRGVAVIPYGGGTSVVGGVEPRGLDAYNGVVSLDLSRLNTVVEVDRTSAAARVQAGASGPHVESQLSEHGLTTRFFPQSFEFSTVGGWVATRAGGHFASGPTHVDDIVESISAVTPAGRWESRRLPGSGAGPSPDRLLLGSEGTLGVITSVWLRLRARPPFKHGATLRMPDFDTGCDAIRSILQAGLLPSNCRLIDGAEAPGADDRPLLIVGFEGAVDVSPLLKAAVMIGERHGGQVQTGSGEREWRGAFLEAPYLRDTLVSLGILAETFETAITWDRLPALIAAVKAAVPGRITCRLTHVYSDGAAPYFTVVMPVERGHETATWDALKARVSQVLIDHGATITHHHAVGRDHVPWYAAQHPALFGEVLAAAKTRLDPQRILNPGVLGL